MKINFTLFFLIEMIGTIAFASSGAMVAIKKQLDLLGVIVLGVTTAVGGGMLRDLLIGNIPPGLFINSIYVLVAFLTVMVLFLIVRRNQRILDSHSIETYEKVMNIFDAIGLGAFTVVGIDTAIAAGYQQYNFLVIFLGVLTGVGGGLLRDIMAGQTPYILRKHVYACASLAGAIAYTYLLKITHSDAAIILSALLVVLIRILATRFCWNLPTATKKRKDEQL